MTKSLHRLQSLQQLEKACKGYSQTLHPILWLVRACKGYSLHRLQPSHKEPAKAEATKAVAVFVFIQNWTKLLG